MRGDFGQGKFEGLLRGEDLRVKDSEENCINIRADGGSVNRIAGELKASKPILIGLVYDLVPRKTQSSTL